MIGFIKVPDTDRTFSQVQASRPGFRREVGGLHSGNGERGEQKRRGSGVYCQ